jgi:hypothetical protein
MLFDSDSVLIIFSFGFVNFHNQARFHEFKILRVVLFFLFKYSMEMAACAQNEHCNRRMKQWGILRQDFQHDLKYHESVFCAIAVMTQICIQNADPLAKVFYKE